MGVYIKGMEMPEHCRYCRFRYDGICHAFQKTQYNKEDCPLVPVPPRTNADRIRAMTDEELEDWYWWMHKEMMYYTDSHTFVHNWLKEEVDDADS